jgi:hypothetical protein
MGKTPIWKQIILALVVAVAVVAVATLISFDFSSGPSPRAAPLRPAETRNHPAPCLR